MKVNVNTSETYSYAEFVRKNQERNIEVYYMKQRIFGLIILVLGLVIPYILNGDATISLFFVPLGVFLILTKEKILMLKEAEIYERKHK